MPLHDLWVDYFLNALALKSTSNFPKDNLDSNWDNVNQRLMKADFHGADVCVVRSRCPSLVGIRGIVVQDTKSTFRILGEDNVVKSKQRDFIFYIE